VPGTVRLPEPERAEQSRLRASVARIWSTPEVSHQLRRSFLIFAT
jgi:hypothetical protein